MKKIAILLTITLSIILMSCKGDTGPMGPPGAPGAPGTPGEAGSGTGWITKKITIDSKDWILMGEPRELNSYYYVDVTIPELTKFVYNEGTVLGYRVTGDNARIGLPYVTHQGEEEGGKDFLWTQTYDFDFLPEEVRFHVTFSDFETELRPEGETFYIVLMWEK